MIRRMTTAGWLILVACWFSGMAFGDTLLFPTNSVWRYLDDGSDQGVAWRTNTFDDAAWAEGGAPLGYGNPPFEQTVISYGTNASSKYVTYYFRRTFTVTNAAAYSDLRLDLVRDDGVVFYLNGVELLRDNMPTNAFTYQTLAPGKIGNPAEVSYFTLYAPADGLIEGTNLITAEVHQSSRTSSDVELGLGLTALEAPPAPAAMRGPYLQMCTSTGIVVRWRTNRATNSVVRYGASPAALTVAITNAGALTEHEVALTGLAPATRYYYSIGMGDETLAGGDENHFFVTAPVPGTAPWVRFWAIGDSGTANHNARNVRDAFTAYTVARPADFWLMLGDNAYTTGSDQEYQAAVFEMYPAMLRSRPLWATLGNHDGISAESATQTGPYYDNFTLPTAGEGGGLPSGTEAYYSFDYGNIHFVCLESHETDRSTNGTMLTWMKADLASTTQQWIIAYWHHPPYTKGSHNSDVEYQLVEMRENALPIIEEAGVDLVLCGHSHAYERSHFLHGHYGYSWTLAASNIVNGGDGRFDGDGAYDNSGETGTVYVVAGSSGQTGGGPLNHPVMHVALNELGSLVIDVKGNRLDAVFIGDTPVVKDRFTIVKGPSEYRLTANGVGPGTVTPPVGYYTPGTHASVTASPAPYFMLGQWSGQAAGQDNPLQLLMDGDKAVSGEFTALLVTNAVPQWWLASHNLATNDAGALADGDADGMPAWAEYRAGTIPTNAASLLAFAGALRLSQDVVLRWSSVAGHAYTVQAATDLTNGFLPVASNLPATAPWNSYTDTWSAAREQRFYRIRLEN